MARWRYLNDDLTRTDEGILPLRASRSGKLVAETELFCGARTRVPRPLPILAILDSFRLKRHVR
jgi:hypothetical protein